MRVADVVDKFFIYRRGLRIGGGLWLFSLLIECVILRV